jgi:hypothetical protein
MGHQVPRAIELTALKVQIGQYISVRCYWLAAYPQAHDAGCVQVTCCHRKWTIKPQ